MIEEFKGNCKFFVQHYSYNAERKRLSKISFGHCRKTLRSKCKGCPYYQPHDISEEIICLSVFRMFCHFNYLLKQYQQQLTEELEICKQKNTD